MSYHTYYLNLARIEQIMWKANLLKYTKKQRGMATMRDAIRTILLHEEKMYRTIDLPIMLEEYKWLQDRHVIFPENKTLLNRLLKATTKIKDSTKLFSEEQTFMLALPRDFKIHSQPATGVLVHISNWTKRRHLTHDFFDWVNLPQPDLKRTTQEMTVCITYQHHSDTKDCYYRAIIPVSLIGKLLNAESGAEYWDILGKFDDTANIGALELTHDQAAYQQVLVRLILAVLLYKKTVPTALISGYPVHKKKAPKMDMRSVTKYSDFTLQIPHSEHNSPTFHYRSWHFKQLMADRYYQGEYENLERGSRVIFVKDTFVNLDDIKPATLKNKGV
jgi:hypothetical protein